MDTLPYLNNSVAIICRLLSHKDPVLESFSETPRDVGTAVAQPMEGTPLVVLELTAPQIDVLLSTGSVKALQEDKPGSLYCATGCLLCPTCGPAVKG